MSDKSGIARQELLDFLLLPSSYPHYTDEVIHIQTHASDVFIAAPYVYKVKKPVNLGFLDFSTLEKRRHFCEVEVTLNRRLCRGTYLGVEEIKLQNGSLSVGGEGVTVEYAVKMRRLPEYMFMKNMLREGRISEEHLSRLVRKLVDFYKSQEPRAVVLEYGNPERIRLNIDENMSLCEKFIGMTLSPSAYNALRFYNEKFFKEKRELFFDRKNRGLIKDCHGDLHLEHVNFASPDICIYDCIEFNDRFRYIDIASDISFMAMDLDYNGYYDYADYFISGITKSMKDETARIVIDFYKSYRAFVRGKVESIRATEPEVPAEEKALSVERARKYFRHALRYAALGSSPAALATFGVIGSGKSTLAHMLGEELSADVISSDNVRKEITGTGTLERSKEGYAEGIYAEDITARTYGEFISRAIREIRLNNIVILDASFSKRRWRDMLLKAAAEHRFRVVFLRTVAPRGALAERLVRREREGQSVSDATLAILDRFVSEFEEPDDLEKTSCFEIDTRETPDEAIAEALKTLIISGIRQTEN